MPIFSNLYPTLKNTLCTAILCSIVLLASCGEEDSGPVLVSVIGDPSDWAQPLPNLPHPAAKLMLETTAQGLVAFDAAGDILPALAQRWIVENDGKSYIFRLRRAFWANGQKVSADDVARILTVRIDALRKLDPNGPLDAVISVVPMTGEVIEITLGAPRPHILQMLAQPQMAILSSYGGTGPFRQSPLPQAVKLTPVNPDEATQDEDAQHTHQSETRILRTERAALAIVRFQQEKSALVVGGRFSDLPLLSAARVDKASVRLDPVQGLFGLGVVGTNPLLDDDAVRAAISMSIDRDKILTLVPVGRWATIDRLFPEQLELPTAPPTPTWSGLSLEQRQTQGRATIERWRAQHGAAPILRIALPKGPGSTLLFGLIAGNLQAIGLGSRQVDMNEDADLRLIDEVAAYDSILWYLGRVGCARKIHCSEAANAQLKLASRSTTSEEARDHIAHAATLMQAHNGYIPLATPVRWSLVSPRLTGFQSSPRARHPLNHLFTATN